MTGSGAKTFLQSNGRDLLNRKSVNFQCFLMKLIVNDFLA